jgi:hypothetical protein
MAAFDWLEYAPADLNFQARIERTGTDDLKSMLRKLEVLQAMGEYHKGRIKAISAELKKRNKKEEEAVYG